ncbi:MAG: metal-sensing transcriptional repressor [Oscillospiraceae bacterium]
MKHKGTVTLLKTAKGQIEGILKMVEDERYCIDISNQLLAVSSVVKKANIEILKEHINTCVKQAIKEDNCDDKIKEIEQILDKILK